MVASPSISHVDHVTGLPVRQFSFQGSGGLRLAAARHDPETAPIAVVAFAHGFTAYAIAYINVLRALNAAGIAAYTVDHRGHGYSEGKRASLNNIDLMIDDFERLVAIARSELPALPLFSLGHSMGGLIVARHGYRYQEGLAGVIPVSAAFEVGEGKSEREISLLVTVSRLLPDLRVLGGASSQSDLEGQSRPRLRNILSDRGRIRLNMARELYLGGRDTLDHAAEWRVPLLLQHGAADTITMPSGSELAFSRASSADRTLELWPDRHHNLITDEGWEEPVQSIITWILKRSGVDEPAAIPAPPGLNQMKVADLRRSAAIGQGTPVQ